MLKLQASAVDGVAGPEKAESLTDRAYAYLKAEIISGRVPAGALLDAKALADTMGVSRTPVREALLRLANEGVVEVNARRGIRVVTLTAADLQAIYEVITALEIEAVHRLTAAGSDRERLAPLTEQLVRMRVATEDGDGEAWNLADEGFHRCLLDLCGNDRLAEAGRRYRDMAQRAHFVALRLVPLEEKSRSNESHADLIRTIRSGDAEAAQRMHRVQRNRGSKLLVDVLREIKLGHL